MKSMMSNLLLESIEELRDELGKPLDKFEVSNIVWSMDSEHEKNNTSGLEKNFSMLQKAELQYASSNPRVLAVISYILGLCALYGIGRSVDQKEAIRLLTKSSEQGSALASILLGICYLYGTGASKQDIGLASNLFEKAGKRNVIGKLLFLISQMNMGSKKDTKKLEECLKIINADPSSSDLLKAFCLGLSQEHSKKNKQDTLAAIKTHQSLLCKSRVGSLLLTALILAESSYRLYFLYTDLQDTEQAMCSLLKAAKDEHHGALLYFENHKEMENKSEKEFTFSVSATFDKIRLSAEKGLAMAQYCYWISYKFVLPALCSDFSVAIDALAKSAKQGYLPAQEAMALYCRTGGLNYESMVEALTSKQLSEPVDVTLEALTRIKKLLNSLNPKEQYMNGLMYESGLCGKKDSSKYALFLYCSASQKGHRGADLSRRRIMDSQKALAKKLSKEIEARTLYN